MLKGDGGEIDGNNNNNDEQGVENLAFEISPINNKNKVSL